MGFLEFATVLGAIFMGPLEIIALGILIGGIISIVAEVTEMITRLNIGRMTRKTLETQDELGKALTEALRTKIKETKSTAISLDVFSGEKKIAEVELRGPAVAEDLREGMDLTI